MNMSVGLLGPCHTINMSVGLLGPYHTMNMSKIIRPISHYEHV